MVIAAILNALLVLELSKPSAPPALALLFSEIIDVVMIPAILVLGFLTLNVTPVAQDYFLKMDTVATLLAPLASES